MKYYENKKLELAVLILCIIMLLPFLVISIYNRPSADDYDYSIRTHLVVENGGNIFEVTKAAWDTNINFYNCWQGLYSSAFLLAFQPGIYGAQYYAFTTFIIMLMIYLSILIFVYVINKYFIKNSKLFVITASTVILTILLCWLPSATEGLYWYNGAMNYMPFVFLNMVNISLLIELYYCNNSIKKNMLLIISILLSFIISGGNHVTSFENILFLLIATIFLIVKKKKNYPIFPLLSAIIGFIIMYIAPGTATRQSTLISPGILNTIFATLEHMRYIIGEWISLPWLLSLIIITPISIEIAQKNKDKFSKKFPIIPIILSLIIICGMFCVPYLPMGGFGSGRVTNVIWITFMFLSWFNYILIWGFIINNKYVDVKITNKKAQTLMFVVIVIALFSIYYVQNNDINSNSFEALKELKDGTARSYCAEMDARIALYNDNNLTELEVKPLKTKSKLLFFTDIGTDPNVWPNTSISKYYGKNIYLTE